MDFIRKNHWKVSLVGSLLAGVLMFLVSYRTLIVGLTEQTSHSIEVATNVKRELFERKLTSVEQQLNLLSGNAVVTSLLSSEAATPRADARFDEYIKSLLDNQGCRSFMLVNQAGEVAYTSNPGLDRTLVPSEIFLFAQQGPAAQEGTLVSKVVLSENEPFPFYVCQRMTDTKGTARGTLVMEIPREFLSIELRNTISMDSVKTYLVSSEGILDQLGRLNPDTCVSCRWGREAFIQFSPNRKIKDTWTVLSVYPVSQIPLQHILYVSSLDGLIAFFGAGLVLMIVIHSVQLVQKAKGITNADIMLVQTTWNAVSEYSINIISGFYKHLFADAPEVKPMFTSERSLQEKRMALMINTIANSADSLEEFKGSISQLAKRHVHMGVKREYFPIVVKAIINSVEEQYGKGFTSAHRKAWYKILNEVSAIMIEEMESYRFALQSGKQHQ